MGAEGLPCRGAERLAVERVEDRGRVIWDGPSRRTGGHLLRLRPQLEAGALQVAPRSPGQSLVDLDADHAAEGSIVATRSTVPSPDPRSTNVPSGAGCSFRVSA